MKHSTNLEHGHEKVEQTLHNVCRGRQGCCPFRATPFSYPRPERWGFTKGLRVSVLVLGVWLAVTGLALAQQLSSPTCEQRLAMTQEQLADVRGAVAQIHQPTAAFQAETLVALNRKLTEAQAHATQQAATIDALRKEVEALQHPGTVPAPVQKPE